MRQFFILWFVESNCFFDWRQFFKFKVQIDQFGIVVQFQSLNFLLWVFLLKTQFFKQRFILFLIQLNGTNWIFWNFYIDSPHFIIIDIDSSFKLTLEFNNQSIISLKFSFQCINGNIMLFEFFNQLGTFLLVRFIFRDCIFVLLDNILQFSIQFQNVSLKCNQLMNSNIFRVWNGLFVV